MLEEYWFAPRSGPQLLVPSPPYLGPRKVFRKVVKTNRPGLSSVCRDDCEYAHSDGECGCCNCFPPSTQNLDDCTERAMHLEALLVSLVRTHSSHNNVEPPTVAARPDCESPDRQPWLVAFW